MSELEKSGTRVRLYPSGMIEVSGDDPDNVALTLDGIARLRGQHHSKPQAELPLKNGAAEKPEAPVVNGSDHSPFDRSAFIDESVGQNHPAIHKLEQHIRQTKPNTEFRYRALQELVGFFITGVKRQCRTRSIGNLMVRLVAEGAITESSHHVWQRAALKVNK